MNTAAVSTAGPVSVWLSSEEEPGQTSWFGGPQEIAYRHPDLRHDLAE